MTEVGKPATMSTVFCGGVVEIGEDSMNHQERVWGLGGGMGGGVDYGREWAESKCQGVEYIIGTEDWTDRESESSGVTHRAEKVQKQLEAQTLIIHGVNVLSWVDEDRENLYRPHVHGVTTGIKLECSWCQGLLFLKESSRNEYIFKIYTGYTIIYTHIVHLL